jgi:photosystem II stability/assembly factor-like uncharacterized protein
MKSPATIIALAMMANNLLTAAVPTAMYDDLQWRFIGPYRGGRVLAIAGVPNKREEFYFGSVNGGVWHTDDAGRTWHPIFDGQPIGSIGAIALAPSDPKTIYVGTGEADMRSDIAQGDGMYKSIDAGQTWKKVGLDDSQQISHIIVDSKNPQRVFVAALGHPYGPNNTRGIFRSIDGGAHWKKVLGPDDNTGAIDVLFEPGNEQTLYAALWHARRTPWSVYPPASGPGSGIFKSTDGGDTWQNVGGNGFPTVHGRVGLAVAPTDRQRLYAIVDAEPGGGLYRSDDAGAHWRLMSGDTRIWQRGWYFGRVIVDPTNADRVYLPNTIVLRSEDGGANFAAFKGDATGDDFHSLWIDPQDTNRQILGTDQGALISLNGGNSWSSWRNQPTAQFYHLATDNQFPYTVYGAQQDSGAAGVLSRSDSGNGISMQQFKEITAGGEADNIAPDPLHDNLIYGGRVDKLDLRTQQTQSVDPTLAYSDYYRRTWTLPLVFSKLNPNTLYFANQRLFSTSDGGAHWTPISPDLTREDPGTPANLDASAAANNLQMGPRRGVIYAIAPSKITPREIWVGTDDGLIWRTQDDGAHWQNRTPKALTGWSKVGVIETSAHDKNTVYAAIDRHRLDDAAPYIYISTDAGANWKNRVTGIPYGSFVNVVREDPIQKGLLYAGTEKGVYLSFDSGAHWHALQHNLPVTSVRDLEIKNNDVVIATHGRGFWILDDASRLRQLATGLDPLRVALFKPAAALRIRPPGFTGTPHPKDEPLAANPPFGAVIDYYLPVDAKTPVLLRIRDSLGLPVRHYSSADIVPTYDASKAGIARAWFVPPVSLSASKGAHRFIWPIHYAADVQISGGDPFADGVWAPPGEYLVELEVDGVVTTQKLTVKPDPRVQATATDYSSQFNAARELESLRARMAQASNESNELLKTFDDLLAKAGNASAADTAEKRAKLLAFAGIYPSSNPANNWWLPPKSLNTLRAVSGTLAHLAEVIESADAAPSADALTGIEQAEKSVAKVLDEWAQLRAQL